MKVKSISAEELRQQPDRALGLARKGPVIIRTSGGRHLVLRTLDDDLAMEDELIVRHPEFKASIQKAVQNLKRGRGIPISEVRKRLKV